MLASFGHIQYVHVTMDTYSHLIFASAHAEEKLRDVRSHCLQAFAYMGVPKIVKTNNGPVYTSSGFVNFALSSLFLIKREYLITLNDKP